MARRISYNGKMDEFYFGVIDLTPHYRNRVPPDFAHLIQKLPYVANIVRRIDGEEKNCLCFTNYERLVGITEFQLKNLFRNANFEKATSKQIGGVLIYRGELYNVVAYVGFDANGNPVATITNSPVRQRMQIILHVVYYDHLYF